ncbi:MULTISPECIES: hypothetical protein [unclassified Roseitalea]|uniref:hypothetical protein n=1 Tax=unclassified Roseitalea TaxID=2639107 RepID=UPI00273E9516|nr:MULTISPECIES: hypothetical protein [unclassified Roseitalea]
MGLSIPRISQRAAMPIDSQTLLSLAVATVVYIALTWVRERRFPSTRLLAVFMVTVLAALIVVDLVL